MDWYKIKTNNNGIVLDYEESSPPVRKEILLQVKSEEKGVPDKICVGYLKHYSGMKDSGGFIIPGNGGEVKAWCDCLPREFRYPKEMDND